MSAPDKMGGADLDLTLIYKGRRIGMRDLASDRLWVFYPGKRRYPLADRVEAVPLSSLARHEPIKRSRRAPTA